MKTWIVTIAVVIHCALALAEDPVRESCIVAGIPDLPHPTQVTSITESGFRCSSSYQRYTLLPLIDFRVNEFPADALLFDLPHLGFIGNTISFSVTFFGRFRLIEEEVKDFEVFETDVPFHFSSIEEKRQSAFIETVSRAGAEFLSGADMSVDDVKMLAPFDAGELAYWEQHLNASQVEDTPLPELSDYNAYFWAESSWHSSAAQWQW